MMTLRALLARLHAEGLLAAVPEDTAYTEPETPDDPWYLRALIGAGAWIAAMFFLSFLFGFNVFDTAARSIGLGVGLLGAAFALRLRTRGLFAHQLAFALSLAGQAAVLGGVGQAGSFEGMGLWVAALALEAGLIVFYPDPFHRFLSTLLAVGAAVGLLYEAEVPDTVHLLVALLVGGVAVLWLNEARVMTGRYATVLRPLGYGLAAGLLGLLALTLFETDIARWGLSTLAAGAGLGAVVWRIIDAQGLRPARRAVVLGGVFGFLALTLSAPGLAAGLFVLVLAVHRGNRVLGGLAVAFLVVFIVFFYYEMNVTLLVKSGILAGSGAVLLLLRWGVMHGTGEAEAHA